MTALCDWCQVGDHAECDWPCECTHACPRCHETGTGLGGCACDRNYERTAGK